MISLIYDIKITYAYSYILTTYTAVIHQQENWRWTASTVTDLESAGGLLRKKLLIELRSPMMQIAVNTAMRSEGITTSLDQLYAQAVLLDVTFRLQIQRLAAMSRGYFPVVAQDVGVPVEFRLWNEIKQDIAARGRVQWPKIKHVDKAVRKVTIHYHGSVSRLHDIVRQRIVFETLADICKCLEIISNDPDLYVVCFKNRFDCPKSLSTAGYRDVVVVIRVVTEQTLRMGTAGHSCELQLAHRRMVRLLTTAQQDRFLKYKQHKIHHLNPSNFKEDTGRQHWYNW
mmetsp:Transcript_38217/g.61591  ORF Transcript_38217/g.61591 Transcript_38217/m.61591 type:complete len:285 (+) Transcript_38217:1549-2403(+)